MQLARLKRQTHFRLTLAPKAVRDALTRLLIIRLFAPDRIESRHAGCARISDDQHRWLIAADATMDIISRFRERQTRPERFLLTAGSIFDRQLIGKHVTRIRHRVLCHGNAVFGGMLIFGIVSCSVPLG